MLCQPRSQLDACCALPRTGTPPSSLEKETAARGLGWIVTWTVACVIGIAAAAFAAVLRPGLAESGMLWCAVDRSESGHDEAPGTGGAAAGRTRPWWRRWGDRSWALAQATVREWRGLTQHRREGAKTDDAARHEVRARAPPC